MKELSTNLVVREEWGVVEVENVSGRHHTVLGGTLRSVEPDLRCVRFCQTEPLYLLFLSLKKDSKESLPSESS